MIHDLDIVLDLAGALPEEIRAAGLSILSDKVDIANVRLAFPGGCIANLTASRVSTERVRKLRLFQPHQYISLDYQKQEAVAFTVGEDRQIGFQPLSAVKEEPLRLEVEAFLEAVSNRTRPLVPGEEGLRALEVALAILDKIEEHSRIVSERLRSVS
jgi:predicted dehydrogenase